MFLFVNLSGIEQRGKFMRKVLLSALAVVCLFAAGCMTKLMQPTAAPPVTGAVQSDQAAIVFFRSSGLGGGVQAPVVESVDNDVRYVGIVSSKMKLLHKTTPGKHYYVVGGEDANLLEADLEGGKIYYVDIEPKMGIFKARFIFVPITAAELSSESFLKDLAACAWYTNNPEGKAWFDSNYESLKDKKKTAFEKQGREGAYQKAIIIKQYGSATLIQ